ncbi:PQQ-binding-like beta-propeller repeat protein [Staphylococcus chromogenes]|nr:PQQ-binding-like beta-propeller repeat protein [Staphylococcus chromogenes]
MIKPLQRSKKDLLAVGAITAGCAIAVGAVFVNAPVRHSELTPAASAFTPVANMPAAPQQVSETFRVPLSDELHLSRPLIIDGLLVTGTGGKVEALNPADGTTVWRYERDKELCSLGVGFNTVVATYRTSAGCGDVTQIDAKTGTYRATRSATAPDVVLPISSNDRVGTVSAERVELWRSDLVRTVEYGDKDAKQEPELQPHEECRISSALTRKELLAVVESCPDQPNNSMLRLQATTPEDSRKPKIKADVAIPGTDAQVIAIGQTAASVYVPGPTPRLIAYNESGKEISRNDVQPSPLIDAASAKPGQAFAPQTADLPHHMTWFDGQRLYLLNPATLAAEVIFDGALGTGVAIGNRIVFPVADGLAIGNWETGSIDRTIPVDRGNYQGPVSLALAGNSLVEKRGDQLVSLAG